MSEKTFFSTIALLIFSPSTNRIKILILLVIKTPCLFYFRSVKFHYVKEIHMMLVAF